MNLIVPLPKGIPYSDVFLLFTALHRGLIVGLNI